MVSASIAKCGMDRLDCKRGPRRKLLSAHRLNADELHRHIHAREVRE